MFIINNIAINDHDDINEINLNKNKNYNKNYHKN